MTMPGTTSARRAIALGAGATAVALATVAAVVLPGWWPILPRAARAAVAEAALSGAIVVRIVLALGGAATPFLAWAAIRARRRRLPAARLGRLALLGLSCLAALAALEAGAAAVRAGMHRFPALPTSFPPEDPGTYRILVLGGSSALGEPYRPWVSVGQIVAWKLGEAVPSRRFEVETLAWLGDSLEQQHAKLAAIARRPDAVVIYSGHNEFAARFEEDRAHEVGLESSSALARAVHRLDAASPLVGLVRELISKNRLDAPPSLKDRHQVVDPPLCAPAEYAAVLDDFSARLDAVVAWCGRIGARPILIIPPANEADYEPGRSTVEPGVDAAERARIADAIHRARALEATEPGRALEVYRDVARRHPGFAEAHYRIGERLRAEGKREEAAAEFLAALDRDGLPIRCQAPFREAYRRVAARRPGCILIDGRRELIAASPSGWLGGDVIEDTHHPNLRGYVALAAAVLRGLEARREFGGGWSAVPAPDVAGCVARFGIDAERLAEACERTSLHDRRVAGYRHDPARRLAESRRFAEAARKLREGAAIDAVGLPSFAPEGRPN